MIEENLSVTFGTTFLLLIHRQLNEPVTPPKNPKHFSKESFLPAVTLAIWSWTLSPVRAPRRLWRKNWVVAGSSVISGNMPSTPCRNACVKIADSQKLELKDKKKKVKYGKSPKPFCVVSVGAFDFGKIMNLRKNRDAYTRFVLGIFGITERDDGLAAKYRVSNVCALKDNNPVESVPGLE